MTRTCRGKRCERLWDGDLVGSRLVFRVWEEVSDAV